MKLYLFGPLRLEMNGRIQLLTGSPARLLGLLGLQARTGYAATRTRLAGTLWPDVDEERARHLLSNTLYRLRRQLDTPALGGAETAVSHLTITPDSLALNEVWLDTAVFRQKLASTELAEWQTALSLYTGDLLEELDDFWLLSQRAELRELYLTGLDRTYHTLLAQEKLNEALAIAHRWTLADPLNEMAHTAVIQLYARLGRYAAAMQQYDTLAQLLATELDVSPLPDTEAIVADLRQQRQTAVPTLPTSTPLVGRQVERSLLLGQLGRLAEGRGGVALLEGDPGMGKTRLLEAVASSAQRRNLRLAWGHLAEHESRHRYAPLPDVLQAATAGPTLARLSELLTPLLRNLLTPLLPRLNTSSARRSAIEPEKEPATLPLATAVHKLLSLLCQQEPCVLLLDDVQWADDYFWPLLPTLTQVCRERPLLLILSFRSQELRQNGVAWAAIQQLDQEVTPHWLTLPGLTVAELDELAAELGQSRPAEKFVQLHQLSGGNPLAARELLLSDDPAASFEKMLAGRLAHLTPNEREALAAAAVLGRQFGHGTWQAMLDTPIPAETFLDGRFLQETNDGYAFQHDLIRAACYQSVTTSELRTWHLRAGQVLQQVGAATPTLAWHFEQGEAWETAVHYHQRAAKRALNLGDVSTAKMHCDRALALAVEMSDSNRKLPLQCLDLRIRQKLAWAETSLDETESLVAQARAENDLDGLLQALLLMLNYLMSQGHLDALQAVGQEITQLARELGDHTAEIQALNQVAHALLFVFGDAEQAIGHSKRALDLAHTLPQEPYLQAHALFTLIHGHLRVRERPQARDYLSQAEALFAEHPELDSLLTELKSYQAIMAQLDGRWEEARRLQHQLINTHRIDNNILGLTNALYNAAHIATFLGQHTEAILFAEELMQHTQQNRSLQDRYMGVFDRTMLVECYTMAGRLDTADEALRPLLTWLQREDAGRGAIQAWMAVGNLRFMQGDYAASYEAHSRALVHIEHRGSSTSAPYICHTEAALLLGKQAEAEASFAKATSLIDLQASGANLTYFRYVQFLLTKDRHYLTMARTQMIALCLQLEETPLRRDYWHNLPVHQDIERHWRDGAQTETVQLAGADVPLGRPLTDKDRLSIVWTLDDGVGDTAVRQQEGKVGLRRHRLRRLADEAYAQGALPTDAELAQALGVSIRTIERDRAALAAAGQELKTRGYGR
ncbi:ATP-binding protein [Candidatus Leptofilum sp.]|uniref:ATP-binding protein n=1 Tax=Candidatus Leptofilum sp. TaxID=3241576 RepID=UPI003B5D0108